MSDLNLERLRYSWLCLYVLVGFFKDTLILCLKIVSGLETVLRLTIG